MRYHDYLARTRSSQEEILDIGYADYPLRSARSRGPRISTGTSP